MGTIFWRGGTIRVSRVIVHPSADLAALILDETNMPANTSWAFSEIGRSFLGGDEFMTYGFPTERPAFDSPASTPTGRVLTGRCQRFYLYESEAGGTDAAAELSIPAPVGLSGAPMFRRVGPSAVIGVITTNLDTYSIVDSRTEIDEKGATYREESRRILSYGIGLLISEVRDWLLSEFPWRDVTGADPPSSLPLVR
jgi:hypothetical protein